LHNGNKDGNTLFGKYTDKLQNNGVSVPGQSPSGGPSRKERKRLEHQKIKEHEEFISAVLQSITQGVTDENTVAEFNTKLIAYIAEGEERTKKTDEQINALTEKLKDKELSGREKKGIEYKEQFLKGQKHSEDMEIDIDQKLMKLVTGGLQQAEKDQFILDIQQHIQMTTEKNTLRAERMVDAPKPKAQSSYMFAPTTVAGRYGASESESCSGSDSDDS